MRPAAARLGLRVVPELPVVVFFGYVLFLVGMFHGREVMMVDYTATFDHWWYFHERLRAGSLAQWNPFSLLGRIAVQWNYVPASLFSPLLVVTGVTLPSFHATTVLGTTLVLFSIYLAGRIAGYGRWLPLLPVALILGTGFRYWIAFLHFATFLAVFPPTIAWLVSLSDAARVPRRRPMALAALLLGIAFLGLRLELMVYATALVLLVFVAMALARPPLAHLVLGAGLVLVLAVASSGWQLAFLLSSTLDNARVAVGIDKGRLADLRLWRWVLASILAQPALVLLLANTALVVGARRPRVASTLSRPLVLAVLTVELGIGLGLRRLSGIVTPPEAPANLAGLSGGWSLLVSPAALVAIALATLHFFRHEQQLSLRRTFGFLAVLFSGFFVSTYAGHSWALNNQSHPYFVPMMLTGLLALGAVGQWLRGRGWILAVLVAYHVVGDVFALPLFEVIGVPWIPSRAALAELPLQILLMLEAATRAGVILFGQRLGTPAMQLGGAVFACLVIKPMLLPTAAAVAVDRFPFGGATRDIGVPNGSIEEWSTTGVPTNCEYHGPPSSLQRETDSRFVANGRTAARLQPANTGTSWLRCSVSDVEALRGRYVRMSVAVMSANTSPGAIQVDLQDGLRPQPLAIVGYRNSGRWERLGLVVRVEPGVRALMLTVAATYLTNGPVYIDDLRLQATDAPPETERVYPEDFPFGRTVVNGPSDSRNRWIRQALQSSESVRRNHARGAPQSQRVRIDDDILVFTPFEQRYGFLPAYSETLNTAPLYASEIPKSLRRIFSESPGVPEPSVSTRLPHPDAALTVRAYYAARTSSREPERPYPATVTVLAHRHRDPVLSAILAEEGTATPRAFVSDRVVHLSGPAEEYRHLSDAVRSGRRFTDQITTSDPRFAAGEASANSAGGAGDVRIVGDDPEMVVLEVTARRPACLLLLDLSSPGWTATVAGSDTPVYTVDMGVRGVVVPAGRHTVRFSYTVPGLWAGGGLSVLAWCIMLAALFGPSRNRMTDVSS